MRFSSCFVFDFDTYSPNESTRAYKDSISHLEATGDLSVMKAGRHVNLGKSLGKDLLID